MNNYTRILDISKLNQVLTDSNVYVRVPLIKGMDMYCSGGKQIFVNTTFGANLALVNSYDINQPYNKHKK